MKGFAKLFEGSKEIYSYMYPREISELQSSNLIVVIIIKCCNGNLY